MPSADSAASRSTSGAEAARQSRRAGCAVTRWRPSPRPARPIAHHSIATSRRSPSSGRACAAPWTSEPRARPADSTAGTPRRASAATSAAAKRAASAGVMPETGRRVTP